MPLTETILGTQCIGDSLAVINSNFDSLDAEVTANAIPAGAVQIFAMAAAPSGWLACDGTAISRATYANLFAAISTTYGSGDGSTTFNLPDLRGYFVRGAGTNSDGTAAGAFGAKVADELKAHTHAYNKPTYYGPIGAAGDYYPFYSSGGADTVAAGGDETRPKNIAMLYGIKY